MSERPRVHVVATGGTIAMTGQPARPARGGAELVAAVPDLAAVAAIEVEELSNLPGAQLTPAGMAAAVAAAARARAGGAVILQGTDTIEETAELAALCWGADAPLVVTGAIRPGGAPGADGPLNLLDAVAVAASPQARGLGPLVVFDGLVHDGAAAIKGHSWRGDAFRSPAPVGEVREGVVRLRAAGERPAPLATPDELAAAPLDALVPIVGVGAGFDGRELDALLDAGARAVVVWSLGAGHVPAAALAAIGRALARVPVAVCAGPPAGGTLSRTYGFDGSETDLARRGALLAGELSPRKARVRLLAALALGLDARRALTVQRTKEAPRGAPPRVFGPPLRGRR